MQKMKIYILPVDKKFQPNKQTRKYPPHSKDYGVEQDFYQYLLKNNDLLVSDPDKADWHYLPIYWTRWFVNHNYARSGNDLLQEEFDKIILDDTKTFTICQYADGPIIGIKNTTVFFPSRKGTSGIDIPLLCSPHKLFPFFNKKKKYLANFVGSSLTHPLREEMEECLKDRKDIFIYGKNKNTRFFVNKILESYVSLCPRGYGGGSFRFFESMQLGVVPFHIGDIDIRPFKKFINWDEVSLYTDSVSNIIDLLNSKSKSDFLLMGKKAKELYYNQLFFQKWCYYVIKELEELK
ncbi:MAG: exostosin family protein [uncultured bacterium]|nr:MAG: exostosin family protein [uncultured bacterium]